MAKELLHNTIQLAQLAEVNLRSLDYRQETEASALAVLEHSVSRLEGRVAEQSRKVRGRSVSPGRGSVGCSRL